MSEATQILNAIEAGDPRAADRLLPLVYDELRRLAAAQMAHERPDHTLDATALVHEAWLRLAASVEPLGRRLVFATRSHFLRAAAEAMRRILVDHARKKRAAKRGGGGQRFELAEDDRAVIPDPDTLLSIDEALTALASEDPTAAEIARLRLFAGVAVEEAGKALRMSRAAAFRDWAYARAWLSAALTGEENAGNS